MNSPLQASRRRRRPRRRPCRIGLTGSLGMGKSTIAGFMRQAGVPVFDADAAAHALLLPDGTGFAAVSAAFPDAIGPNGLDRGLLGATVFADASALKRLEGILHPLVQNAEQLFFRRCALRGIAIAASDIPLLFETGAMARFDVVAVASAPYFVQRQRVMRRPGMTVERFERIVSRQWPDSDKRRAADVVIPTGRGKRETRRAVGRLLVALKRKQKFHA